ncbi:MAG: SRPBCC family protein [Flavobacteriales bacterium]|uniref:SRPBCC family protein n=1 Tax=Candidatus Ulvibacter alkanivorans TaxID=2267620 RepID=UPI000DF40484|nr:SRPBCC family protein [Candidatus Ulvibacter alkanivorans]MCH2489732.1 SRPBCC family protein [Flavobacteriales bacterium]
MKYTIEIIIDLPREEVIKKMDNPDNMKHWQRGLLDYEMISGIPGKEGAKMKLDYKMGKREMSMVETIIKNQFPSEFHATYDTKGVHNMQRNYFEEVGENKTKWISESEFQFAGFGMKLMGFLMPGAFKKQSKKFMINFKNFAENGTSVADEQ